MVKSKLPHSNSKGDRLKLQSRRFIFNFVVFLSEFFSSLYLGSSGLHPEAIGVNSTNENINHRQLNLAVVLMNLIIKMRI
jgi:hypothetical protein